MKLSPRRIGTLLLLASAGLLTPQLLLGCSKTEAPAQKQAAQPKDGMELSFSPNSEELDRADRLVEQISKKSQRFPYAEASKKENAQLFTYLAATSDDPVVIAAALQAIQSSYSHRSAQKRTPDADLERVLIQHLQSKEPAIAGRALSAARVALQGAEPAPQLVATLLEVAKTHTSGPGRFAVLEALSAVRPQSRSAAVQALFTESLAASDPYVLSAALGGLQQSAEKSKPAQDEATAELRTRVLELAAHDNPGVRGRALLLLASLGDAESPEVLERVQAALGDDHPFVRASASEALGRLGHRPAAHALMTLLEDKKRAQYDLKAFKLLDGRPGAVRHRLPGRSLVAESAVQALAALSDGQLTLERVDRKQPTAALAKNVEAAQAWYTKARPQLPAATAPLPARPTNAAPASAAAAAGRNDKAQPTNGKGPAAATPAAAAKPAAAAATPAPKAPAAGPAASPQP